MSRAAARALDAAAQERFGIPGIVLMENAARGMAEAVAAMAPSPAGTIAIVCGSGNNGGDGYAMARHLANAGFAVDLIALRPPRAGSEAAVNAAICRAMGIPIATSREGLANAQLIVDAIFGTGLDRPPQGLELDAIRAINARASRGVSVYSVDLPSGVDNDGGQPFGEAVWASATGVTVAPRPAMDLEPARGHFGRVSIIDIGAPRSLVEEFGTVKGCGP